MNQMHSKERHVGLTILVVLMLGLVVVNLILTVKLSSQLNSTLTRRETKRSLPCAAVPIRFVADAPECANQLLQSMNVTNVKVLPKETEPASIVRGNGSIAALGEMLQTQ